MPSESVNCSNSDNVRSRLRSSTRLQAAAVATAAVATSRLTVAAPAPPVKRRPRVKSNPNPTSAREATGIGAAARLVRKRASASELTDTAQPVDAETENNSDGSASGRQSSRSNSLPGDIDNAINVPQEEKTAVASPSLAGDGDDALEVNTRSATRPVRACTTRARTASLSKTKPSTSTPNATHQARSTVAATRNGGSSTTNDLQRKAVARSRSIREKRPMTTAQSEPPLAVSRDEHASSKAHSRNTQTTATPRTQSTASGAKAGEKVEVTQKRIMDELEPLSYTDEKYASTLYRKLATDKKINEFLAQSESEYATVEPDNTEKSTGSDRGSTSKGRSNRKSSNKDAAKKPTTRHQWTQIPPAPVKEEHDIYPGLIRLLESIVAHFHKFPAGVERTIVNTSSTDLKHIDHQTTRPDIVICAKGPSFQIPDRSDAGQVLATSKNVGYTNAASVIEVKRDETSTTDDAMIAQLSMYCR